MSGPCVYQVRNIVNGNKYVGSTIDLAMRAKTHLSVLRRGVSGHPLLQRAYNEYGEESFRFEVLEFATMENLRSCEQKYLDQKPEYNTCTDVNGRKGLKSSPEHVARMRAALKGRIGSMKGRKFSEEHKLKLSESLKGRQPSIPKGSKRSPEAIAKIRAGIRRARANQESILSNGNVVPSVE
jgi:group I intron endonuclease